MSPLSDSHLDSGSQHFICRKPSIEHKTDMFPLKFWQMSPIEWFILWAQAHNISYVGNFSKEALSGQWTMNNHVGPVTEIGKCTSPSKEMNQLQKTIWGEEIFALKFGLENSGNGGTLQVLATTCHTADTCRHRFSKDLCRIRGHVSMTNKNWQRRQREMACVCLDHTKASCLYAQVLTVCLQ